MHLFKISKLTLLLNLNVQILNLIHETFLWIYTNLNHLTALCIIKKKERKKNLKRFIVQRSWRFQVLQYVFTLLRGKTCLVLLLNYT